MGKDRKNRRKPLRNGFIVQPGKVYYSGGDLSHYLEALAYCQNYGLIDHNELYKYLTIASFVCSCHHRDNRDIVVMGCMCVYGCRRNCGEEDMEDG